MRSTNTNMLKICFITTGDIKDIATAKRALGMANPLFDLNYEVHIVLQDTLENRNRVKLECNNDIYIQYYKQGGTWAEIKAKNEIFKRLNPDIIYICGFVIRNIPFLFKGKALILTEHSELQSGIPDIRGLKHMMSLFLEYFSLFKSDGILNASNYLQMEFSKRASRLKRKLPQLYFPYAYNKNLYKPVDSGCLSNAYLKYKNTFNFVFLGTITKNYGAFIMLQAFSKIVSDYPNSKLIMLGKGRHYLDALDYVTKSGLSDAIELPGYVKEEDIASYFSIADVFLSPMNDSVQDWARCPSKLYMYLPFRKPVITCKIGEPALVLEEKAIYYEAGSYESMAESMSNAIDFKREELTNPDLHNWEHRTKEFDQWIKCNFVK